MRNIDKLLKNLFLGLMLISILPQFALADDGASTLSPQDQQKLVSQAAFSSLLKNSFPLTPQQIQAYKQAAAQQQKANAEAPPGSSVQSNSQIIPISLKPGGPQKAVRIGQGLITSLVFTDQNGKVWPIVSYSVGNPSAFNVQWDKGSGVLMVQGEQIYSHSNIAVMLKGLDVPVMINLMLGQKQWDYLDYLQIQSLAPGDTEQSPDTLSQAPAYLTDILNGVPPMGAVQLQTSNSGVEVWSYQGHYLVLTQATLMSPAWKSRTNGPGVNPYHAYEIPQAPFLMVSDQGNLVQVQVFQGVSS